MATDTALLEPPARRTVAIPAEQRFVFDSVSWEKYLQADDLFDDRRFRMTFDRGRLEFMTVSHLHEFVKSLMSYFLPVLMEEFGIKRKTSGSMTFRREDLDRGMEPDQCYYLANEPAVRGKDAIDLNVDPPPDLAVEVEVSRSALDRLDILAALGVPEVWCVTADSVRILELSSEGDYRERPDSVNFPGIQSEDVARFLRMRNKLDEESLVESFREWVKTRVSQ